MTTETVDQETASRRRARDRLLVAGVVLPIAWIGATVLYGWSAMLRIGRWPMSSVDDPVQVFGRPFHSAAMLAFSVAIGIGGLLFLLTVAAIGITPGRPSRDALRLAALTLVYCLAGIYIHADPVGVLAWIGD